MKRNGPNCRLYFRAFLKRVEESFRNRQPATQCEEEYRAAKIMQGLVRRHFILSRLEAERNSNPFWSRYNWDVKGRTIIVWLPVSIKGRGRRAWLEENIDAPEPLQDLERERIQGIINRKLIRESLIPLRERDLETYQEPISQNPWGESFETSLATEVAEEKARKINRQRSAIKALGKENLKQLIHRIFDEIGCSEYKDVKVAGDFGLSKATLSRFAGRRWHEREGKIPDLWLNTAHVLSSNKVFKEVAQEFGFWKEVEATIKRGSEQKKIRIQL